MIFSYIMLNVANATRKSSNSVESKGENKEKWRKYENLLKSRLMISWIFDKIICVVIS